MNFTSPILTVRSSIKINPTLPFFVALFLALAPVLDPYIVLEVGSSTLRLNDVFALLLSFLCILKNPSFPKKYRILLGWCFAFLLMSLVAWLGMDNSIDMLITMKNIIVWAAHAFMVAFLWECLDREWFFRILTVITLIGAVMVILQFLAGNLGLPMWDGKIPGIPLSKYDQWSGFIDKNTGDIRPCGIFQESSYFGIYALVAYTWVIKKSHMIRALIIAVSLLLSSSLVAIVGLIVVTVYIFLFGKRINISAKILCRLFFFVLIAVLAFFILMKYSDFFASSVVYIRERFLRIDTDLSGARDSSAKLRLIGALPGFATYGIWQKIFGVGAAQFSAYLGVRAYSNNFVTVLLDYGILGLVFFIGSLLMFFKKLYNDQHIYFLILILVFAVDRQWFNWYFFYLFTACIAYVPIQKK